MRKPKKTKMQIMEALRDETQTALSEITIFEKALAIRQGSGKYDLSDLSIATDAMYYEPCETIEEAVQNENNNHHKYIFQSPIHVLDSYLLDFDSNPLRQAQPANERPYVMGIP